MTPQGIDLSKSSASGAQFQAGGQGVALSGANTFLGAGGTSATETNVQTPAAAAESITTIAVHIVGITAGQTATVRLRKNGSDSGLSVAVIGPATDGNHTGSAVTYAIGDLWDFRATDTAADTVNINITAS